MEFFGKLMSLIGFGKPESDPIANLPVEVAQSIFRLLDPHSLLNAAQVSRGWLHVCQGDSRLRATARRHLRREKRRAYDLSSMGKPQASRRIKTLVKLPQKVSVAPTPVMFTVGPSGVSSGRTNTQNTGQNSGSRSKVGTKRSMLKFR